jgi:hypothetical protein
VDPGDVKTLTITRPLPKTGQPPAWLGAAVFGFVIAADWLLDWHWPFWVLIASILIWVAYQAYGRRCPECHGWLRPRSDETDDDVLIYLCRACNIGWISEKAENEEWQNRRLPRRRSLPRPLGPPDWAVLLLFCGAFGVIVLLAIKLNVVWPAPLFMFGSPILWMLYTQFGIRCPDCHRRMRSPRPATNPWSRRDVLLYECKTCQTEWVGTSSFSASVGSGDGGGD